MDQDGSLPAIDSRPVVLSACQVSLQVLNQSLAVHVQSVQRNWVKDVPAFVLRIFREDVGEVDNARQDRMSCLVQRDGGHQV